MTYYCCTISETRNMDLSNEVLGSIVKWFAFPQINEISGPFYPTNPVYFHWAEKCNFLQSQFNFGLFKGAKIPTFGEIRPFKYGQIIIMEIFESPTFLRLQI